MRTGCIIINVKLHLQKQILQDVIIALKLLARLFVYNVGNSISYKGAIVCWGALFGYDQL